MNISQRDNRTKSQRDIDKITETIIKAAISVHKELGPGLLESAYEACLCYELTRMGLSYERQKELSLQYKEIHIDCGFRIDMLVEKQVVIEIKTVDSLTPVHKAQLITYLKLTECRIGLLINFNVKILKNGIKRIVYGY
jgi:GxxExxY protein